MLPDSKCCILEHGTRVMISFRKNDSESERKKSLRRKKFKRKWFMII